MDSIAANILRKTNGASRSDISAGQLATYKDGVEQVVRGADFISVEDPSYLGDYVPDFNILAGPMLVNSYDEYEYLLETPEVQDMFKESRGKRNQDSFPRLHLRFQEPHDKQGYHKAGRLKGNEDPYTRQPVIC